VRFPGRRLRPDVLRDAAALAGLALITTGCAMAWPPAGFLVAGVLLLALALLPFARRRA